MNIHDLTNPHVYVKKAYLGNERVWGPKNTKFGSAVKKCSDYLQEL